MLIQWYPGHMNKALKQMQKDVKIVDAIIYVLDARAPLSCLNPKFQSIIGNKPVLFVLNKCDLSDTNKLQQIQNKLTKNNNQCIYLDSTVSNSSKLIAEKIEQMLKEKIDRNEAKGIVIPMRAMIIGVPNSGKSTIANNLCGNKRAVTGDKPGVTKSNQWIKISKYLEILDTPGTLWPSFENQNVAKQLAYIGSIKDDIIDIEELALEFIIDMTHQDFSILKNRYNLIDEDKDLQPIEIYEKICLNRKFILKGNEIDYSRGAKAILDDYRKGRMGNFMLNTVQNV